MTALHEREYSSPVGPLILGADDSGRLSRVAFGGVDHASGPTAAPADTAARATLEDTARQLDEYFAGTRQTFDVELALRGTEFQRAVWEALVQIPYGATASYGDIARAIGRPNAVRAVGQANGRNPVAIVVPCHRVIGSNNGLTGYGGGIDRKRYLLALEGSELADLGGVAIRT